MLRRFQILSFVFLVFICQQLTAQSGSDYERLALLEVTGKGASEEVNFEFKFETTTKQVTGTAASFMEGYDSIAIQSYEYVALDGEKVLKLESFVFNRATNHRLKWTTAVDYVETDKKQYSESEKLVSGKFIQFGAYRKYKNAVAEMERLVGFEIEMIKANDQYKLIAPYQKGDYTRARTKYPEKNVWVVNYNEKVLISVQESK